MIDQRLHQLFADAVAARILLHIDRMFAGMAITVESAPVTVGSVACDLAVEDGDDDGKAA
ncbi:hypothetical protein D3C80_2091250 [compost metagenome]